ncbi:MAG: DNA-directed RNA polymerase subunit E'' [Candidatus Hadarchaeum yellowstonense]|uniref:Transcription elongation factor Spt4 n=1 Tax=Hadarchaeum yellowstonense TaxID=1776334 RepID=A0A147JWP8_HADYE|nr:MAG: DNA-directed RNA polymerase subunit E'' [Candidatus Hadarchaeum yellowstonense]
MKLLACRNCNYISDSSTCPNCGSASLSEDWAGYVIVLDVEESEIAKKLNITKPGKYALKVR